MPPKERKINPPPQWQWEASAVIEKRDITPTHALIGKVNAFVMDVAGECRREGTVLFQGFAGARGDDGLYHGVYRFSPAAPDSEYDTFASLPGLDGADAAQPEVAVLPFNAPNASANPEDDEE